jgi:hypothetical protein
MGAGKKVVCWKEAGFAVRPDEMFVANRRIRQLFVSIC